MTKIIARDIKTMKAIKVTLRKPIEDLTTKNLSVPGYTHIGRTTISGRLTYNSSLEDYQFTPNK